MSAASNESHYGLGTLASGGVVAAPQIDFLPREPKSYRPRIGIIGCGGISEVHLKAYSAAKYDVAVLCDRTRVKAEGRQREFFPAAAVTTDWRDVLARADVEVVDVTPHPRDRLPIVEAALRARKHVLSQKPFVLDLDEGRRLCDLADAHGVTLAVNQNGRFAPHFAWIRNGVCAGLLGEVTAVDVAIHWNHQWVAGTLFDDTPHLLLFDFGIHWFDLVASLFCSRRATRVTAGVARAAGQRARQPLLAQALIEFGEPAGPSDSRSASRARATLTFHGASEQFQLDTTTVAGTKAVARASGPDLDHQTITLHDARGTSSPPLTGSWFTTGFHGAMAELLCAIEERRAPLHSARGNLASLELAFAACASSLDGLAHAPGSVCRLP